MLLDAGANINHQDIVSIYMYVYTHIIQIKFVLRIMCVNIHESTCMYIHVLVQYVCTLCTSHFTL